MFNQSSNKRIQESMRLICESFLYLLQSNNYRDLTINEICDNAGVGRKTFYRNFDSKSDIIDYILCIKFSEMVDEINQQENEDGIFEHIIIFWANNKELLSIISKNYLQEYFSSRLAYFLELFRFYMPTIEKYDDPELMMAYYFKTIAAEITSVLNTWSIRNYKDSIEDLINIVSFSCFGYIQTTKYQLNKKILYKNK